MLNIVIRMSTPVCSSSSQCCLLESSNQRKMCYIEKVYRLAFLKLPLESYEFIFRIMYYCNYVFICLIFFLIVSLRIKKFILLIIQVFSTIFILSGVQTISRNNGNYLNRQKLIWKQCDNTLAVHIYIG